MSDVVGLHRRIGLPQKEGDEIEFGFGVANQYLQSQ